MDPLDFIISSIKLQQMQTPFSAPLKCKAEITELYPFLPVIGQMPQSLIDPFQFLQSSLFTTMQNSEMFFLELLEILV
jgi:hypothetical protein